MRRMITDFPRFADLSASELVSISVSFNIAFASTAGVLAVSLLLNALGLAPPGSDAAGMF